MAWSQVESIAVFYVLLAGIGILQAAVLTEAAFAVVARRFGAADARSGIVTLSLWAGFAGTVFIPVIQTLLDYFGWRDTLLVLGAINIVFCGGLYAVVIDPAADAPKRVDELGPRPLAGVSSRRLGARISSILGTGDCADGLLGDLLGIYFPRLSLVDRGRLRKLDRGFRAGHHRPSPGDGPTCDLGICPVRSGPGDWFAGRSWHFHSFFSR